MEGKIRGNWNDSNSDDDAVSSLLSPAQRAEGIKR